jgi:hypothetical protein
VTSRPESNRIEPAVVGDEATAHLRDAALASPAASSSNRLGCRARHGRAAQVHTRAGTFFGHGGGTRGQIGDHLGQHRRLCFWHGQGQPPAPLAEPNASWRNASAPGLKCCNSFAGQRSKCTTAASHHQNQLHDGSCDLWAVTVLPLNVGRTETQTCNAILCTDEQI